MNEENVSGATGKSFEESERAKGGGDEKMYERQLVSTLPRHRRQWRDEVEKEGELIE